MLPIYNNNIISIIFFKRLQKNTSVVATEWNHARSRVHVSFNKIDTILPFIISFLYIILRIRKNFSTDSSVIVEKSRRVP